jgi:outer membrane receptor protein involved in Fe transport
MKKKQWKVQSVWIVLFLFLPAFTLFAGETGKIAGTIIDKASGEPLVGANIQIPGTMLGAAANLKGEYFIINIPPGTYELRASFMGYKTEIKTNVQVLVDKTTRVDFKLEMEVIAGEEVTVSAFRSDRVEPDVTATKMTYDIGRVESLPGITDVGDVINLQADVDGSHFRGGRSGEAIYLISGANIMNPLTGSNTFEPITIGLEQVEVYTSGFSAEYGNVQSGVINMVTKEGGKKWKTKLDFSSTNSRYKTWGGGAYSKKINQYYDILSNPEQWLYGIDPTNGSPLYDFSAIGFDNYVPKQEFGWPLPPAPTFEDSLRTASLMRVLWLQLVRQVGLDYASPDFRTEFSTSGPISENISMFVATRFRDNKPIIPTPYSDRDIQVMSNIVYHKNQNNKFKLSFNYNHDFVNAISNNFYQWLETVTYVPKQTETIQQIGGTWNHVFNPATFMDIKTNYLWTSRNEHSELVQSGEYSDVYETNSNWRTSRSPSGHQGGNTDASAGSGTRTKTLNTQGNITSQIDSRNLVKSGFQFNYYDMRIDQISNTTNVRNQRWQKYNAFPFEGAIYIQDKMEYQGFIANIGLRYDFYNFNTEYFTNQFSPYRNPNYDPTDPSAGGFYDAEFAAKQKTKLETVLQPRIGFSFPVSEKTVLHLNYGVFTQRPPFQYIFVDRYKSEAIPNFDQMGNAELRPEKTISYDMGIVRALPYGLYLDLSAYYKNVTNLVQNAQYVDKDGFTFDSYDNREYANVKGFQISLDKNYGFIHGNIRYNWESVKGKSSSPTGAADQVVHYEGQPEKDQLRDPKDIYLDFNRLHKFVANLGFQTSSQAGFEVLKIHPLANLSLSGTYRFLSGRPFTWDMSGQGLRFNQRTPNEHHSTLRMEKGFIIGRTTIKVYGEIYNVLNQKIWSYNRTFGEGIENLYRGRYMEDSTDLPPEEKRVMTETEFSPYITSLQAYLLSNSPRWYRFGISFEF